MNNFKSGDVDLSKFKDKPPTIMQYIHENCAALTLIIAVITPIVSVLLTLMLYSYYHGYYGYFLLSDIWIDLSNKNNVYYIIFMIFISLAIMILNVIPIIAIKFKGLKGLIFSIVVGLIIYAFGFGIFFLAKTDGNIVWQSLSVWLIMYGIGMIDGIYNYIKKLIINHKSKSSKISDDMSISIGITIIIICIIIEVIICYFVGIDMAKNKSEFKALYYNNEYMVVLHESQESFVIAKSELSNDEKHIIIYANEQVIIDNSEIEYMITNFDNVSIS